MTGAKIVLLAAAAATLLGGRSACALDGALGIQFTPAPGWRGFELLTRGDAIAAIADPGYGATASRSNYDGIGAFSRHGVVNILFNTEQSSSAVNRITINQSALQRAVRSTIDGGVTPFPASLVTRLGYAYEAIYSGAYHASNHPLPEAAGTTAVGAYGDQNFSRFCSSQWHFAEAFGPGRGFVDPLYLTGEEVSGGLFYALDAATGAFWEAPDLGVGLWENAAQIDTGDDAHVALVMLSDVGGAPGDYLRLYVGAKGADANNDGAIDFLERNGLRGGTTYYFVPGVGQSVASLPDGVVTGAWSLATTGALRETKLEDVDTNPLNGNQAVFAATNDGVYRMELDLAFDAGTGAFNPAGSATTITQILNDNGALAEPDNLDWSRNGKIYVQEDGAGDEMFEVAPDGTGFAKIATGLSEPSGILDVSALLGYEPGSVLLTSFMGGIAGPAQLSVMISPTASPVPAGPDVDFDGRVDGFDFLAWQRGAGTTPDAVASEGDADANGTVDGADLAAWVAQFGGVVAAPEPTGFVSLAPAFALFAWQGRQRRRAARVESQRRP